MAATALGAAALASTASADPTWAFNVGVASDYVFRGIDQTTHGSEGELFGGVDLTASQFYAGTWLSNTGPNHDRGMEYDIYGGWRPSAGGINWDLGVIFYGYTDSPHGFVSHVYDTVELRAGGTLPVGAGTLGAVVFWSPDFAGSSRSGEYAEINGSYTFAHLHNTAVSAALGHQWVDNSFFANSGYTTWNVGATIPITSHFSLDLRYVDTDRAAEVYTGLPQDQNFVATLKATF